MSCSKEKSHLSLDTFIDANQNAYSTCIFIACKSQNGTVNANLSQAKSRITLLKKITFSRIELMTPTIAVRLFNFVKGSIDVVSVDAHFWTDYSTVLVELNDKSNGQCLYLIE